MQGTFRLKTGHISIDPAAQSITGAVVVDATSDARNLFRREGYLRIAVCFENIALHAFVAGSVSGGGVDPDAAPMSTLRPANRFFLSPRRKDTPMPLVHARSGCGARAGHVPAFRATLRCAHDPGHSNQNRPGGFNRRQSACHLGCRPERSARVSAVAPGDVRVHLTAARQGSRSPRSRSWG